MARLVKEEAPQITRVIGIAMAGIPIASGMALAGKMPAGFTRKMENVKSVAAFRDLITSYGEHSLLEGELVPGDRLALVDDLVTRFDSKEIALEQVKYEVQRRSVPDVQCSTVLVVLDREQGGQEAARNAGVQLLSLIPFKKSGLPLLRDVMDRTEWDTIRRYLDDPDHFQHKDVQHRLEDLASRPAGNERGRTR